MLHSQALAIHESYKHGCCMIHAQLMLHCVTSPSFSLLFMPSLHLHYFCKTFLIFLVPKEQQIHKLQRVTTTPLSIFENRNDLEVLAFPTLYPNGENGFGTIREVKVTPLEYFSKQECLVLTQDGHVILLISIGPVTL